jgi:RNA polymerase sigma factor (sigma-70 family)
MSELLDPALVRAAQGGDIAGLGALLERHRARLHAAAVAMLGHGPRAEDAVHDTFLIALRRIGDLRDPSAARAWLMRILGNVCLAELRRPTVEPTADIGPAGDPGRTPVEEAIDRTAVRDWVWSALGRLPEPLRVAVMLRYFSSANSYDAIAELCGTPVGTVRSRLNAARRRLADELLQTAADAHPDAGRYQQRALATGAAMAAFERTGNRTLLRDAFDSDLRFTLADRVERQGLELFASLIAADFEDGVRTRPTRVIAGEGVAIIELWLDSPPEQPLHCPPALTQIHFHNGQTTQRIASHYAPRP